jgi:hypothetical protein
MEQFFISRVEPEPWRHTTRRCSHHHATSTTVWMMSWKKYQSLLLTSSFRDDTNSLNVRVYKCVNSNHFLRPRGLNTTMIVNGELLVWWCEKSWRPITTPAGMAKDIVKGKHEDLDHSLYLTKFFFFFCWGFTLGWFHISTCFCGAWSHLSLILYADLLRTCIAKLIRPQCFFSVKNTKLIILMKS